MPRLPVFSAKELINILEKIGYRKIRQRGSHIRLYCKNKKSITVPNHKIIGQGLLRKILRDAELSISEFNDLI